MLLKEEIERIKNLMSLFESSISKNNMFKDFQISDFKNTPPPTDNSEETKKEIKYLKSINLKRKFVQEKDDIDGNFIDFLKTKNIDEKILIKKINNDLYYIVLYLKNFYKRPRPFRLWKGLHTHQVIQPIQIYCT